MTSSLERLFEIIPWLILILMMNDHPLVAEGSEPTVSPSAEDADVSPSTDSDDEAAVSAVCSV